MARIRTIKPEFWADEQIAGWPVRVRLAYIALWNEADDEGRFRASEAYLRSRLFPYEPNVNMREILDTLSAHGKISEYSVKDQCYGVLHNFTTHQRINRPTPSKLPKPLDNTTAHGSITEQSLRPQRGNREQGSGIREQGAGITRAPASRHGYENKIGGAFLPDITDGVIVDDVTQQRADELLAYFNNAGGTSYRMDMAGNRTLLLEALRFYGDADLRRCVDYCARPEWRTGKGGRDWYTLKRVLGAKHLEDNVQAAKAKAVPARKYPTHEEQIAACEAKGMVFIRSGDDAAA